MIAEDNPSEGKGFPCSYKRFLGSPFVAGNLLSNDSQSMFVIDDLKICPGFADGFAVRMDRQCPGKRFDRQMCGFSGDGIFPQGLCSFGISQHGTE